MHPHIESATQFLKPRSIRLEHLNTLYEIGLAAIEARAHSMQRAAEEHGADLEARIPKIELDRNVEHWQRHHLRKEGDSHSRRRSLPKELHLCTSFTPPPARVVAHSAIDAKVSLLEFVFKLDSDGNANDLKKRAAEISKASESDPLQSPLRDGLFAMLQNYASPTRARTVGVSR